jgi:plastocyanin
MTALATVGVSAASVAEAGPALKTTTVRVTAGEYFFKFSRPRVPVGIVIFKVHNGGEEQHDLTFTTNGKKTPVFGPGGTKTLRMRMTKPGKWQYICSVGEHALHGMKGTLRVVKS